MDNKHPEQQRSVLSRLRSVLDRVTNRRSEVIATPRIKESNFFSRIVNRIKGNNNNTKEILKPSEIVYQSEIIDSREYRELFGQITALIQAMQQSKNPVVGEMYRVFKDSGYFSNQKIVNSQQLLKYLNQLKGFLFGNNEVNLILSLLDDESDLKELIRNIDAVKIENNLLNLIIKLQLGVNTEEDLPASEEPNIGFRPEAPGVDAEETEPQEANLHQEAITAAEDYFSDPSPEKITTPTSEMKVDSDSMHGGGEDMDEDKPANVSPDIAAIRKMRIERMMKSNEKRLEKTPPENRELQKYGGEEEAQILEMLEQNKKEAEEFINGEMESNRLKYFELSQGVRREVIIRIKDEDKLLILRESIGTAIDENLLIELLSFGFTYGLIELSTDHSLLNYLFSSIDHSKLYSQLLHTFGVYDVAIKNYILYLKTKGQLEEYKSFLEQEQLYYQRLISKHKKVIENIDNEAISSIESVAPEPEPIPINQKAVDIERRRVKKLEERRDRTLRNLVRKFDEYLEQSLSDYESIVPRYLRGAESNAILVESKLRSVVKYEFDGVNLNLNFIELSKLLAPGVDEIEFISKFFNFLKSVQHLIPSGSRLGVFSVDLDVQKTNNLLRLEEGYEKFYANLSKIDEKSIAEWTNGIDVDIPEEKDKALEFLRETLKKVGRSISVMAEALKNKLKVQEETDLTPSDATIQDIPSVKETLRLIQESRGNPEARRRVKHLTDSDLESKELQKFKPKYHSYYKLYNGGSQLPAGVKVFSTGGSLGAYYQYFGNAPLYSGLTKRERSYFQTPIIKELIGRVKPEFVKRIVESQDDQVIIQILDDLEAPSTKAETFEDFLNKSISDINKKFENTEKLDDQELKVVKFIVSQFEIQDTEQNINRGMLYDPKPVLVEVTNTDSSQPAEESQLEEEDLPELESLTNELDDQPHTNTPRKPVKDVINPLDIHGPKNEKFVLDESLVYPVEVNESTPYDNLAIDLLTELELFIASIKDKTLKKRLKEKKESIKKEIDKLLEVQGEITPVKIKIKFNYLLGILRDLGLPEQGLSTLRSKLSAL